MTTTLVISSLLISLGSSKVAPAPVKTWTISKGLSNPESAYYEPDSDTLFVSSVAGSPTEKDGRGWISKVSPDGTMIKTRWVTGLHAPKGMRAYKGVLWVTNIDEVISIDIRNGKVLARVPVKGSQFLNDIAIDAQGDVYVSDTLGSKIFKIRNHKVEVWAEGPTLGAPNGLLIEGDRLFVATWGLPKSDWTTDEPGTLYSMNLTTQKKRRLAPNGLGNLDGLERYESDGFLVSDWMAGTVFYISKKRKAFLILEGLKNSADIGYSSKHERLFVPLMGADRLEAYQVAAQS